jgi:hypothetical protein
LQGTFCRARENRDPGQWLLAQPFRHLLRLPEPPRREFTVGVGDRPAAFGGFGMTPQNQIQTASRMSSRLTAARAEKGATRSRKSVAGRAA